MRTVPEILPLNIKGWRSETKIGTMKETRYYTFVSTTLVRYLKQTFQVEPEKQQNRK